MENNRDKIGSIFIQNVMSVDSAVFDAARGIIGQSWQLDVEVSGQLAENHFVHDFSELKSLVKATAKSSIDHALIIPIESRHVNYSESKNGETWEMISSEQGRNPKTWKYICPKGAVYPIRCVHVNKAVLEQELNRLIRHRLPDSVIGVRTTLHSESAEATAAFFHYTHGITGHLGLCQRLFHGHRSRIEVRVGHERRPDLEHFIARELFNSSVHIITPSQVHSSANDDELLHLSYRSKEGSFEAWLPKANTFSINSDTSIECLTAELANRVRDKVGGLEKVEVKCFEGIGKGATAEA